MKRKKENSASIAGHVLENKSRLLPFWSAAAKVVKVGYCAIWKTHSGGKMISCGSTDREGRCMQTYVFLTRVKSSDSLANKHLADWLPGFSILPLVYIVYLTNLTSRDADDQRRLNLTLLKEYRRKLGKPGQLKNFKTPSKKQVWVALARSLSRLIQ